jgi:TP901 family phage tail tape measure protein
LAGSFDAKVEISTADAVGHLRHLKKEVQENAAAFRDFNKALIESKHNVKDAAQQMTKLAQARAQHARISQQDTKASVDAARARAVDTVATARAGQEAAKTAMFEARRAQAVSQGAAADARRTAVTDANTRATARANDAATRHTESLSNTRYMMYDVGATLGILSGALMALPAATAAVSMAYQRDFAQVLRVTEDLTNGGLDLRNEIKDIARDIPVAFGDLTRITQLGAQMGIANDALADFTETTAKFVAVTGISADAASQLFGRLESSFNPDRTIPDFFNKVGASIAYVGAKTVATDPEIASMMNQIGSLGANAGMTADQTIGLAAALASVRVQPELARGTLTRVFGQINRLATDGADALESYGKVMGNLSGEQAKALWESDPSEFFNRVIEGLHRLSAAEKTAALDAMGIKASRDVSALTKLAVGYDVLEKSMAAADKGFSEGVALDKMSKPVFDTVIAKLAKLANAWKGLADSVGGASLAPIGAVIDMLADFANGLDDLIRGVPLVGGLIAILMGLSAVTAVWLGFKAAQAFVLAGLIGFQQMAGNRAVVSAMSLSGVLKELGRTFTLLTASTNAATAAAGRHSAAAGVAAAATGRHAAATAGSAAVMGRAAAGAKAFGSGLLAMAGGPIGVALIGLTALITHLSLVQSEAKDAGEAIAMAMKQGEPEALKAAAEQLKNIRVSLFNDANGVGGMGKSVAEVANETGIGFDRVLRAVVKGKDGVAQFNAELDAFARSKGYESLQDMNDKNPFKFAGEGPLLSNLDFLKTKVEAVGNANSDAAKTAEVVDGALKKAGGTAADIPEDFDTAASAVDKMNDALKALNDTIFGTLNAETDLQAAMARIGEGLGESGAYDTRSAGGRTNISNLEGGLEAGRNYYKQLIDEGTLSAQQAALGYAQFVDGLIAKIRATGGDVTPMVDLANRTKAAFDAALKTGYPSSVPVAMDTKQVPAKALDIKQTIQKVLDNNEARAKVGADVSEADTKLSDVANSLAAITGLPYSVVLDALTDPAHDKAQQVYDVLTQVTDGTYKADVDADTTAAITNVKNFAAYAREELAQLQREYDYAMKTGGDNAEGGFLKGSSNLALGRDWYGKGYTRARPGGPATSTVKVPKQVRAADLKMPELNLDAVVDGYQKVQDEAEKTKKKTKELWQDQGDGIDEATSKINDYANRLKTGLTSAFDKQYGMVSATDAYHSALNAITKKNEEQLKQLDDMKEKVKQLNNERNKDLVDANKAKIEQQISLKYGEGDRAMDYGVQAQTALDAAAAKQKDIDATNKQARELQDGIGKLTGFSQAAIDNRAALRDLETKMLDMIVAYANTGASIDQVRGYAQRLTGQFQMDVGQIGFNQVAVAGLQGNMQRYVDVVNKVPFLKPTKVEADTEEASDKIEALGGLLDDTFKPREVPVTVKVTYATRKNRAGNRIGGEKDANGNWIGGEEIWEVFNEQTGQKIGRDFFNRGGLVPAMASGGMVPGVPPRNPRADNMMAQVDGRGLIKVRSREFIQPEEAVDYYGPDFMEAIRTLSLPKFSAGGSPSGASGSGYGLPSIVGLDAETLAFLASLKQEIRLYADGRELASAVNDGNRQLAAEGRNR